MDKLVYIAGPYRANSATGIAANIQSARLAAIEFAKMGIPYICPHLNSAYFEEYAPDVPDSFYLKMGLEILARCDAIFVLRGWEESEGTKAEMEWWLLNRMPSTILYQSCSMWKIDMLKWFNS